MTHSDESQGSSPTAILKQEHEVILKVLGALEKMVAHVEQGALPDREALEKAIEFFAGFADKNHHMKEEDALFPALVESGMPVMGSPIGVMLHEHEEGRRCLKGLREVVGELDSDPDGARSRFLDNAQGYTQLLREHIEKENSILFPMADVMLTPQKSQEVLEKYASAESAQGAEVLERYRRLAEEMGQRTVGS